MQGEKKEPIKLKLLQSYEEIPNSSIDIMGFEEKEKWKLWNQNVLNNCPCLLAIFVEYS